MAGDASTTPSSSSPVRIGYVPEHYLLPLHLATFPFSVTLIPFASGTGHMISSLRNDDIDLAIGLTEGWVAGILKEKGQKDVTAVAVAAAAAAREGGGGRGDGRYKIVGRWVQSPLRWAIVTGRDRDDINSVADLGKRKRRKVAVSRLGSGSHIMAFVLAQQEGWTSSSKTSTVSEGDANEDNRTQQQQQQQQQQLASEALDIVPLGPLPDLIAGVQNHRQSGDEDINDDDDERRGKDAQADFFMWEHYTTKPYFTTTSSSNTNKTTSNNSSSSSDTTPRRLKKIGEIYSPWPSWHIAANSRTFPDQASDTRLKSIFAALDGGIRRFHRNNSKSDSKGNSDSNGGDDPQSNSNVHLLGTKGGLGLHYDEQDAREWLDRVRYVDVKDNDNDNDNDNDGDDGHGLGHGTRGVDRLVMDRVVDVLKGAGVVEQDVGIVEGDGVVGIDVRDGNGNPS